MPPVRCWQVDSFTAQPFGGNPAAVCLLQEEASDGWMQAVAAEMNLAETAFVRHRDDGFQLRWFSPTVEVDLCGHATLATAHVLWAAGIAGAGDPIRFHTHSGPLTCTRNADWIAMDFPATPAADAAPQRGLLEALDVAAPRFVGKTRFDVLVVLGSAANLRALRPDLRKLAEIPTRGVIVTAPSDDARYDFLARFFAPAIGIDEDPVTGSAYCCLGPYWAERLGKPTLTARQVSARGGDLRVRPDGDRVIIGGQAVTVWQGELV